MVAPSAQHNEALQAFHTWKRSTEAQSPGFGGPRFETECPFIPRANLAEYFGRHGQLEDLLDAVLDSSDRPAVDPDYVREHYLQSFAILLCIGEGRMIHHFQQYNSLRDQKLPYHTKPDEFPYTTPDKFEDFKQEQWQFCASKLEYNMNGRFKEEDILPITYKDQIGEGGSAIIYKIVIEEGYNSLRPSGHVIPEPRRQHKNTFVLKTYRDAEAQQNYRAERDAYLKLRWGGKPSEHILAYYGSFIHGNSYHIILEYADQGTLEMFMKRTKSPSSAEETLLLWDRLLNVTHGLMTIHGKIENNSSASQILNGIHQDVKPANILVFGGNGTSPYDCYFKIADLGLTHFKPSVSLLDDPSDLDAFGTRAYGAPETYRSHEGSDSVPLKVTKAVDMWSIGCVFSEVAVWAHHGWKRVVEYRRRRSEEIEAKGGVSGEYIFHWDGNLLDAVNTIHQDMLGRNAVKDLLTRSVLDRLVDDMLQHESRPYAENVFDRSKRLVKDCEKRLGVSANGLGRSANGDSLDSGEARNRTRSSPQPPDEHYRSHAERNHSLEEPVPPGDSPSPPPSSPSSSLRSSPQRHYRKSASHSNKRSSNRATAISQPAGQTSTVTPGPPHPSTTAKTHEDSLGQHVQQPQEGPERPTLSIDDGHVWKERKKSGGVAVLPGGENLTSLYGRDHIFLIDNSATMKQHKDKMERVISLLAYMVKKSDKDGLDVFFTQTVSKVNSQKSSRISASIHQNAFAGVSDMRGRLQSILQEHINKFGTSVQAPKSFLTRQPPPQPQRPLSFYILTDAKWQPTDVGQLIKDLVQSMRAKSRPKEHVAIQFIRFGEDQASIDKLDELDHGLGLKAIGMDIVDHTYWDGNVWKMLLGALNDWYDDDPT